VTRAESSRSTLHRLRYYSRRFAAGVQEDYLSATDLIDRLAAHKTLGAAPREELAWLAAHGTLRHLEAGTPMAVKGQPLLEMFILLSGHIAIYMDRAGGRQKVMEWRTGDVTGVLPYSRMAAAPGNSYIEEPSEVLTIARADFPALIRECHEVTSILVHTMLDRARVFTSSDLQDEKMKSLGKLSAGLAHELNNPVSAIERNASLLEERVEEAERSARALGASDLTDSQLVAVDELRAACLASVNRGVLSPIQQAEREDGIADWLAAHHVDDAVAVPLAETSVTLEALDRLAAAVDPASLNVIVRWAAAGCSVHKLAAEIRDAAMRISGLVILIKGFTHMDQAMVAEPVDLHTSLGNTVALHNAKARMKSASVTVALPQDLPRVRGFVGELNQIWANLIDNALDAIPESGHVDVTATCERQRVVVRIIDNGPGIPPEIRGRLFEPFFTTKPVGQGTGMGLDIVRRLISHNEAEIDVESVPGRTEFRVTLPVAETRSPERGVE
jgi:signal transduction histidine kinase